jgi:hypothetical protein
MSHVIVRKTGRMRVTNHRIGTCSMTRSCPWDVRAAGLWQKACFGTHHLPCHCTNLWASNLQVPTAVGTRRRWGETRYVRRRTLPSQWGPRMRSSPHRARRRSRRETVSPAGVAPRRCRLQHLPRRKSRQMQGERARRRLPAGPLQWDEGVPQLPRAPRRRTTKRRHLRTLKRADVALGEKPPGRGPVTQGCRRGGGAPIGRQSPPSPNPWSLPVRSKRQRAGTNETGAGAVGRVPLDAAALRKRHGVGDRQPASPQAGEVAMPCPSGGTATSPLPVGARNVYQARGANRRGKVDGAAPARRHPPLRRRNLGRAARRTKGVRVASDRRRGGGGAPAPRRVHPLNAVSGVRSKRVTATASRANASPSARQTPSLPAERIAATAVRLRQRSVSLRRGRARRVGVTVHRPAGVTMPGYLPIVTSEGQRRRREHTSALHLPPVPHARVADHKSGQPPSSLQGKVSPPRAPKKCRPCLR